jgi:hypothetical protein
MEVHMMEKLVGVNACEAVLIAGGRSEEVAHVVETIAICVGLCARLIYMFFYRGQRVVAMQAADGKYQKF